MKSIYLTMDNEMFYKMKKHKLEIEQKTGKMMTWEQYITKLFGINKDDR